MDQLNNVGDARSSRLTQWVAFLIFSAITLGSAVELFRLNTDESHIGRVNQQWAVVCSAVTFILTFLVVITHFSESFAPRFIGTQIEGLLCVTLFAFWVSVVTIVSDSRNGLAVDHEGAVSNANLYYFSWAGFICSITLLVSYLRAIFNVDLPGEIRTRSARLNLWSGMLATSIVVVGSSSTVFDAICGMKTSGTFCGRTVFGIVLGAISTLMSLYVVGMKIATSKAPFWVEAVLSTILFILYIFGVAFLTSSYGPGAPLGNLYYFTWLSFFLSFMLVASCHEDYQTAKTMSAHHSNTDIDQNEVNVDEMDGTL